MATKKRIEQDRGKRARDAILREIRRREDAGEAAPHLGDLTGVTGLSVTAVHHHAGRLAADGLIVRAGPRAGWELTRAGRIATN